ncbi:hypothetical protein [Aquimarina agarivorans]|uniref:hypothetical protein n=1 Tax=Aquimarina agarivorans TaxID=980584 RepID=UPI000248E71D|nr:hypothetical protein [Aquimarina agarivorans]
MNKSEWVYAYEQLLESAFDLRLYDCRTLGGIERPISTKSDLHCQFTNGGIDVAVKNLTQLEKEEVDVLAFSVGGTIAWKACLQGLKIKNLYAISATRLRHESKKPSCNTRLYYGSLDNYVPAFEWFKQHCMTPTIFKNKYHELYTELDCIQRICGDINRNNEL